jgi:hypothetical protein
MHFRHLCGYSLQLQDYLLEPVAFFSFLFMVTAMPKMLVTHLRLEMVFQMVERYFTLKIVTD